MSKKWITVEREYGSGGTEIGRKVAELAGVPFYGREILEKVSELSGVDIDRIEAYEETATGGLAYSMLAMSQSVSGTEDMLSPQDKVYIQEQRVIMELARKESAVFLGHCAAEAIEDKENIIRVFIRCSDAKAKKDRIIKEYGIAPGKVDSVRRKFDKKRANYYVANTGKRWDDFLNYDVVLDSGRLGIDGCVKALERLLEKD